MEVLIEQSYDEVGAVTSNMPVVSCFMLLSCRKLFIAVVVIAIEWQIDQWILLSLRSLKLTKYTPLSHQHRTRHYCRCQSHDDILRGVGAELLARQCGIKQQLLSYQRVHRAHALHINLILERDGTDESLLRSWDCVHHCQVGDVGMVDRGAQNAVDVFGSKI